MRQLKIYPIIRIFLCMIMIVGKLHGQYTISALNINSGGCPQATISCFSGSQPVCFVIEAGKSYPPVGASYNFSNSTAATTLIVPTNPSYYSLYPPNYTGNVGEGYACCTGLLGGDRGSITPSISATVGSFFSVNSVTVPVQGSYLQYRFYDVTNPSNPILLRDWSSDPNLASHRYTTAGTYYIGRVARAACQPFLVSLLCNSCQVVVGNPCPTISISASSNPSTIISGSSATLTASASGGSGSYTYRWSNGATGSSISVSPTSTTSYSVTATDNSTNCTSSVGTTTVNVQTCPTISVSASSSPSTIYSGNSTTLMASAWGGSGNYTYRWSNGAFGSAISVAPTFTTSYSVTVTDNNNNCTGTGSTSVTVLTCPNIFVSATASPSTICGGATVTLSASASGGVGGYTYSWSSGLGSGSTKTVQPLSSTTYFVTATDNNQCRGTGTVAVNVSTPTVSISPTTSAVCLNGSVLLTSTVNANGTAGSPTYQWQSSPNNSTWSNINGATSSTYSPPTNNIGVIYYRVGIYYSSNPNCGTLYSNSSTITVNDLPSVNITPASNEVCIGGTATLTSAVTGGAGTITYQWQSSPDGVAWTTISGATGATYNPPTTAAGMNYYRVNINASGSNCNGATSNITQLTIVADPSVTITGLTNTCSGNSIALNAAVTGGSGTVSYQWQSSPNNSTWTNISGATSASYTTPALTATTHYRVLINQSSSGCSTTSSTHTITVVAAPTVSVTGGGTICQEGTVNLNATVSGGSGTPSYQWQSSPNNSTWTDIAGAINSTYTSTPLSTTTYFRVIVAQTTNGCSVTSSSTTVNVVADPTIQITGNTNVCTNGSTTLTATVAGGSGTSSYQWQLSTDGSNYTNVASGGTSLSYNTGALSQTTYYRFIVNQTVNGCRQTSDVTVNIVSQATVNISSPTNTVCSGNTTALTATVIGGSGTMTYQWQSSPNGTTWTNVGTNSATYTTVALTSAMYYRVSVTMTSGGCTSATSSAELITVVSRPVVSITGTAATICNGGNTTLTATASGGSGALTYQWQSSPNNSTWTDIVGATNSNYTTPSLSATTYYRVVVAQATANCATTSSSFTVTVSSSLLCCPGNNAFTLHGNATLSNGAIRLTAATTNQSGQAWSTMSIDLNRDFRQRFRAYLGNSDGGADGLAFTLRGNSSSLVGGVGEGLGYGGISPSVNFEFDTYQNSTLGDIVNDHFALHVGGNAAATGRIGNNIDLGNIENGQWHTVIIDWQSATKTLSVNFNNTEIYRTVRDIVALDFGGNSAVSFGFTASTGMLVNEQSICVDSIIYTPCNAGSLAPTLSSTAVSNTCPATTVNLNSLVTSVTPNGATLVWFTSSTPTGTPYSTPTAAVAGTYYAFYYDAVNNCYSAGRMITVTISSCCNISNTNISGNQTICIGETATALSPTATPTGSGTLSYQWQQSTINCNTGFSNIAGATNVSYTPSNITQTTYFRLIVTNTQSGNTCSSISNCVIITYVTTPSVTVTSSASSVAQGGTATLTANVSGAALPILYQWQSSHNQIDWYNIPTATNATYVTNSMTSTNYYRVLVTQSGASCPAVVSNAVGIQVAVGSVGNYVWTDINNNGINDEPTTAGLIGVKVELWSVALNRKIDSTYTAQDANGNNGYYNFIIRESGDYFIKFPTAHGSKILTTRNITPATDNNSDADPITGQSPIFTINVTGVGVAKDNPTIDAGFKCAVVANVTINGGSLSCSVSQVTLSASPINGVTYNWSNGNTSSSQIAGTEGVYTVTVTDVANGCTATASATVSRSPMATVGNYVWTDADGDGINDEQSSAGINGLTIELWNNNTNTLVATTVSASLNGNPGYYQFCVSTSGNYYIKFPITNNVGKRLTIQNASIGTDNNSDADFNTGKSPVFSLDVNGTGIQKNNMTIDAGYLPPCPPNDCIR